MNDLAVEFKNTAELEMRVRVLEEKLASLEKKVSLKVDLTLDEILVRRHGEVVNKSVAARMLGVTRCTIYNMIKDGRIDATPDGKDVIVRSVARYIDAKRRDGRYDD